MTTRLIFEGKATEPGGRDGWIDKIAEGPRESRCCRRESGRAQGP